MRLSYTDHEGVNREVEGVNLYVDALDRHWIWSERLRRNVCYDIKGRENALAAAVASLLRTVKAQDERIAALERIADLAHEFAAAITPVEEE